MAELLESREPTVEDLVRLCAQLNAAGASYSESLDLPRQRCARCAFPEAAAVTVGCGPRLAVEHDLC